MALRKNQIDDVEIAVIGAGVAGIATAFYLCTEHKKHSIVLIDPQPPLSYTSAQSGENYRNWWPHPVMTAFTDHSIDLMERIAVDTGDILHMTRRGYAIATRQRDIGELTGELYKGYSQRQGELIRFHDIAASQSYQPAVSDDWRSAPDGVDVLEGHELIQQVFPWLGEEFVNVVHIRRAGDISSQQMGQYMLDQIKARDGRLKRGRVTGVQVSNGFELDLGGPEGVEQVRAEFCVNAAGPFVKDVAAMFGTDLPVFNILQQKIAFEDRAGAISRQMPFSVDVDERPLDWSAEERGLLAADADMAWLVNSLPGGLHCRPDGGARGRWIKVGWAYNETATSPVRDPVFDEYFPEIILRRAAAMVPALKTYNGSLPPNFSHYGGYYTMTDENWPLIGPLGVDGAFVVGALSGFGTMAACAAGQVCAAWIAGAARPDFADWLSLARYVDAGLMRQLREQTNKGVL